MTSPWWDVYFALGEEAYLPRGELLGEYADDVWSKID